MQSDVLVKKKMLLQQISPSEYRELLGYIRKVYLADYDLKILMARKFSNLFFALLPLAKEEYGGRVEYLYEELAQKRKERGAEPEPVIISNRALEMLKEDIQAGRYKRILLADDIIIHGRTLSIIYDLLESWLKARNEVCKIKVYAYAENMKGVLEENAFLQERNVNFKCNTAQWRSISNEIVNIFYLLGPPYTSYVPNGIVSMQSESGKAITEAVNSRESGFTCREESGKTSGLAKCYVYVEQAGHKMELSRSIRIYEYKDLNQYIFVPMVMLKPIEKGDLQNQMKDDEPGGKLSKWMDKAYWQKLSGLADKDIYYQTAVYMISAFWGWKFMEEKLNRPMHDMQYEIQEEEVNFGGRIFDPESIRMLDKEGVCKILSNLNADYNEQPELQRAFVKQENNKEDFGEDFKDFQDLNEEFEKNLGLFEGRVSGCVKEMIDRYLYCNGELDEKRCAENQDKNGNHSKGSNKNLDESRRLIGYPLERVKAELEEKGLRWVEDVLAAIDSGKGSIVPKVLRYKNNIYFLSVIHAGEQNYKYLEETYFPFLYGMYQIERDAAKTGQQNKCSEWKDKFLEVYGKYWESEKHFLLKDDIDKIKNIDMTEKFQEVLEKNAWDYFDEPVFDKAIEIAKNINIITTEELDVKTK